MMAEERGEFRGIYVALIDDPDFQQLSAYARWTFMVLKLNLGKAGIGVCYPGSLVDPIGIPLEMVSEAIDELSRGGWVVVERNVIWIRNGLRFEPSLSLNNDNHRASVEKHIRGLPKLGIVNAYAEYYGLATPYPGIEPKAAGNPIEIPSRSHGDPIPDHGIRITEDGVRNTEGSPSSAREADEEEPPGGGEDEAAQAKSARDALEDAVSAVIQLANNAMTRNALIDQQRLNPIPTGHGSRQEVFDWIAEGIPIATIRETVEEVALGYQPTSDNQQIASMKYFGGAVRKAERQRQAKAHGGANGTNGRRAAGGRGAQGQTGKAAAGTRGQGKPGKWAAVTRYGDGREFDT